MVAYNLFRVLILAIITVIVKLYFFVLLISSYKIIMNVFCMFPGHLNVPFCEVLKCFANFLLGFLMCAYSFAECLCTLYVIIQSQAYLLMPQRSICMEPEV